MLVYMSLFMIGLAIAGLGLMVTWWNGGSEPRPATSRRTFRRIAGTGILCIGGLTAIAALVGVGLTVTTEPAEEPPLIATSADYEGLNNDEFIRTLTQQHLGKSDSRNKTARPSAESVTSPTTGFADGKEINQTDRAALIREIQDTFDKLAAAARRRDEYGVATLFDEQMHYGAILGHYESEIETTKHRSDIEFEIDQAFGQGVASGSIWIGWDEATVEDLRALENNTEITSLVHHMTEEGVMTKVVWWLTGRDGTWRVYDFEYLLEGQAYSRQVGLFYRDQQSDDGLPPWNEAFDRIQKSIDLTNNGDYERARRELRYASVADLPSTYESLRLQSLSNVERLEGDAESALALADRAIEMDPSRTLAKAARVQALIELERYRLAYEASQEILDQIGDDSLILRIMGEALDGLDRPDEALQMYRRAVAENPNDIDALLSLGLRLPAEDKSAFADGFLAMYAPENWYVALAEWLTMALDEAALVALNDAYRSINPTSLELGYYEAVIEIWQERYEQAALSLEKTLRLMEESDLRTAVEALYLEAMVQAGRPIRAYRNAIDRDAAFETVGAMLMAWRDADYLERLVDLHQREKQSHPYLPLFQGAIYWLRGDFRRADAMYAEGYDAALDEEMRDDYIAAFVYNRMDEGRPLSAYGWRDRHDQTFLELAVALATNSQGEELAELLHKHREIQPDSQILWAWYEAVAAYLTDQFDTTEELLIENRDEILSSDAVLESDYYYYLSLAQTKQGAYDRATASANTWNIQSGDPIYLVFVEAMRGNPVAANVYLEKCLASGLYDPWTFYANPDISSILLGPGYEAFREKHPEPAQLRQYRRLLEAEEAQQAAPLPPRAP